MKKIILIIVIIAVLVLIVGLTTCSGETKDPDWKKAGCGGSLLATGCLGGSVIKDIMVEPAAECLKLHSENCNGAILVVENDCDYDLKIGGKTIYAREAKAVELARNKEGEIFVVEIAGNFEQYNPEDENLLSVDGTLGDNDVTISYLKKNVCGTEKIPEELE